MTVGLTSCISTTISHLVLGMLFVAGNRDEAIILKFFAIIPYTTAVKQ